MTLPIFAENYRGLDPCRAVYVDFPTSTLPNLRWRVADELHPMLWESDRGRPSCCSPNSGRALRDQVDATTVA